jgi:hypothetical protein
MLLNISYLLKVLGGEGGIRTHGTLARTTVFETAPIDHSGTSPSDRRPRNFRGREWRGAVIQHRLPPANPAAARASGPCHVAAREPHGACRRRACGVVRNRPPRCSKEVSHAEPSRPKITISSAMSRLIARAFSAGLAGSRWIRSGRLGECMTQQIGKEPQTFALPSSFIVEHQAPSRPTSQGC